MNWKGSLQIVAELRAENDRLQESNNLYQKENKKLLRAITLSNRQFKRLTEKYEKLKKGKQVKTLQELVLKRDKEIRRLRGKIDRLRESKRSNTTL